MPTPQDSLYREIPLTQGQVAIVDAADYDWLMQWNWNARWNSTAKSYYAVRNNKRDKQGRQSPVSMHREILGLQKGDKRQGDHANHDTLDNRRSNLRIATQIESSQNRGTRADNTSGYKGVFIMRNWAYARITVNRVPILLGRFPNNPVGRLASSRLYQQAAKKYFGEFFCER